MTTTNRIRPAGTAAIYARVSTEQQALPDATSLDRQEKACRRTATRLNFSIADAEYVIKEAHSGSDPDDRPGLERLYIGAARRQFQYVLMDVIDRTTRAGPFNLVDICMRFLNAGVEPVWAGHPEIDMTTQHGQNEAVKKAIDAFEDKETIRGRFQGGKNERIEDGLLIRAFMAYGYKWDAERPLLGDEDMRNAWLPNEDGDPSPAAVIRRIYTYLAEGWRTGGDASAVKISDQLHAEGILTPSQLKRQRRKAARWQGRATRWQFNTIVYMVQNPTYKGSRPQRRWQVVPRDPKDRKAKGLATAGRIEERDPTEWEYVTVPALVDEQTWEDANKQLKRNVKNNHKQPKRYTVDDVLLYGAHVYCAECTRAMQAWPHSNAWYYHCSRTAQRVDGERCPGCAIPAHEVDTFVWYQAKRIIQDPDYLRSRLVQGKQETWTPEQQIAHYADLIAQCDAKEAELYNELEETRGRPALESLRKRIYDDVERNTQGRQEYVKKQDAARAEQLRREQEQERLAEFAAKAQQQAATLDDLDAAQRRRILLDLHAEVHIARRDNATQPRIVVYFFLTPGGSGTCA